jgi:hypothetical protein
MPWLDSGLKGTGDCDGSEGDDDGVEGRKKGGDLRTFIAMSNGNSCYGFCFVLSEMSKRGVRRTESLSQVLRGNQVPIE